MYSSWFRPILGLAATTCQGSWSRGQAGNSACLERSKLCQSGFIHSHGGTPVAHPINGVDQPAVGDRTNAAGTPGSRNQLVTDTARYAMEGAAGPLEPLEPLGHGFAARLCEGPRRDCAKHSVEERQSLSVGGYMVCDPT